MASAARTWSGSKRTNFPTLINGMARRFCCSRSQRSDGRESDAKRISSRPSAATSLLSDDCMAFTQERGVSTHRTFQHPSVTQKCRVKRWQRDGADKSLSEFAAIYARTRGMNEDATQHKASVSQLFAVVNRCTSPITWTHHYIIWSSGKTGKDALQWLARASKGHTSGPKKGQAWSTGDLRKIGAGSTP